MIILIYQFVDYQLLQRNNKNIIIKQSDSKNIDLIHYYINQTQIIQYFNPFNDREQIYLKFDRQYSFYKYSFTLINRIIQEMFLLALIFNMLHLGMVNYHQAQTNSYAVDSNHPFSLSNDQKSIKDIVQDDLLNYWVLYMDDSISKMNNNFTILANYPKLANHSLQRLSISQPFIDLWNTTYLIDQQTTHILQNITSRIIYAVDDSRKKIFLFDYDFLFIVDELTMDSIIINNDVFSINTDRYGQLIVNQIVLQRQIILFIDQKEEKIWSFQNESVSCAIIQKAKWITNNYTDTMNIESRMFIGMINGSIFNVQINITFTYLPLSNSFSWQINRSALILYNRTNQIKTIFVFGTAIISQGQQNLINVYDYEQSIKLKAANITYDTGIQQFFMVNDRLFLAFNNTYVQLLYNLTSNFISYGQTINYTCSNVSNQLSCFYKILYNNQNALVFERGAPFIYKLDACISQNRFEMGQCIPYSCSLSNCEDCSFDSDLCSQCSQNYTRLTDFRSCYEPICHINNCQLCTSTKCQLCEIGFYLSSSQVCSIRCQIQNCIKCNKPNVCSVCTSFHHFSHNFSCISTSKQASSLSLMSCSFLSSKEEIEKCQKYLNSSIAYYAIIVNSFIVSTPVLCQSLKWLGPILNFNNDYWYYIYHNRNYDDLFVSKIFFNLLIEINNQRMIPFYGEKIDAAQQQFSDPLEQWFQPSKMEKYADHNIVLINKEPTYFTWNIKQMLLWNYTTSIIFFIIFSVFAKFLPALWNKNKVSSSTSKNIQNVSCSKLTAIQLGKFIIERSTYAFLLICLIEANAPFLSFEAGLQLKESIYLAFEDKLNYITAISFLFACLIVCLTIYILFWAFKIQNARMLVDDRKRVLPAIILKNAIVFLKNVVVCFCQAVFMNNYTIIICIMSISKIVLLFFSLKSFKYAKFKTSAFIQILYLTIGLIYDLFLTSTYIFGLDSSSLLPTFIKTNSTILELVLLGSMIILILFQVASYLMLSIYNIFHQRKRNKISQKLIKQGQLNGENPVMISQINQARKKMKFDDQNQNSFDCLSKFRTIEVDRREVQNSFSLKVGLKQNIGKKAANIFFVGFENQIGNQIFNCESKNILKKSNFYSPPCQK